MGVKVIMLYNKCLVRVLVKHTLSQVGEVIAIGFVSLSSALKELDLFTTVAADAHCAGHVMWQELLLPLGKD